MLDTDRFFGGLMVALFVMATLAYGLFVSIGADNKIRKECQDKGGIRVQGMCLKVEEIR